MIKNDRQLNSAYDEIERLDSEIAEANQKYSGVAADLVTTGLEQERERLWDEIFEYKELRDLPLKEAVEGPLRQLMLIESVGELLAKIRVAAGLSQAELAQRLGWSQSNVARFESENYGSQTVRKIVEFAAALDVSIGVVPILEDSTANLQVWIKRSDETDSADSVRQVEDQTH